MFVDYVDTFFWQNAVAPSSFEYHFRNVFRFWARDSGNRRVLNLFGAVGRIGEPLDLKIASIYLASSASNFVTGQSIFDGALMALLVAIQEEDDRHFCASF